MTTGGGVVLTEAGAEFSLWSRHGERVELCLFDAAGERELRRLPMMREGDMHRLFVAGMKAGARYGYRVHGPYEPERGLWFDPAKLLVDPYAVHLDRSFRHDARLAVFGEDTADLVPKAIVTRSEPVTVEPPVFEPGGFIYEVPVRGFTMLHPEVPQAQRGTVAALAHPAVIAHLKRIGVDAVELLPITAWIDERHLPPLGLSNSWGYNPVAFMALDPRLCPGGLAELRQTVAALRAEGIGTILDLVFNHSGESDRHGATLSLRGIDHASYYRHVVGEPGVLVNDTGCGNTLACDHPQVRRLIVDSLRHFVTAAGVDGFRFDLAPILGRTMEGFDPRGETLTALLRDPVLEGRVMIAEPWDIGPGGYQAGNFPPPFLEWNDRARDTIRRYWRGDAHMTGAFATALAGSSDVFARSGQRRTRSVNFIAAHDGFTLADLTAYNVKHNEANGEDNRDGHNDNHSWNNGVEGPTSDMHVRAARTADRAALLATLFASRGTIMLTAGDEAGRSQRGNNNAYAQDNEITWLDWSALDEDLLNHTAQLSSLRKRFAALGEQDFFTGQGDVTWFNLQGEPMRREDWEDPQAAFLGMVIETPDNKAGGMAGLAILFNRAGCDLCVALPAERAWKRLSGEMAALRLTLRARSVEFLLSA
ncbi:glycogen debranching protein GlgX [Allorhizobium undicola]|uniref:glycogen debranching protein GlgX n=1 Tax=Allorhizobium undicola TaxID=78527 RepID=UPI003D3321C7